MLLCGSADPDAELVIIYGNCQAPHLTIALSQADANLEHRGYLCVLNHAAPGHEVEMPTPQQLQRCKFYMEQLDTRESVPEREFVRQHIHSIVPKLVFPSYMMTCFWPFTVPDPRDKTSERFPWGRFPHGNLVAMEVIKKGLTGKVAYETFMELSTKRMPDLQRALDIDFQLMEQRDGMSDVRLTDFVRANFRDHYLFWSHGHMSAMGVEFLATTLFEATLPFLGDNYEAGLSRLQQGFPNVPPMGNCQYPIHPAVAQALGLSFYQPDMLFSWHGEMWTFEEYMTRYIAYDTSW
ncbi:MAG TPA: WcbI family polysaccharide biosynthesis putative acetyltransferase [Alphaproteobacteria bacterium]|jgi:hypothetical protein